MQKIDELERCYAACEELRKIRAKEEALRARAVNTTQVLEWGPKAHGGRDGMARFMERLDELERERDAAWCKMLSERSLIEARLRHLPDREAEVLRHRYAEGMSWRQVMREMRKSKSYVFALHRFGIARYQALIAS